MPPKTKNTQSSSMYTISASPTTSQPKPKPKKKSKAKSENTPHKPRKQPSTSSMHPKLHGAVSALLAEHGLRFSFHESDSAAPERAYDTTIIGRFACYNESCNVHGWASGHVAITIRMYPGQRYNAKVYHQRCQGCDWISKPWLDDSYAERVAYRLKKWSGIEMETPYYRKGIKKPHLRALCEGCKAGHCSQGQEGVW